MRHTWFLVALGSLLLAGWTVAGCESKREKQEERTVEGLEKQLKAAEPQVRAQAAQRLGQAQFATDDARNGAIDALEDALDDSDQSVRRNAAQALKSIGTPEAYEALRDGLQDMQKDSKQGWEELKQFYDSSVNELKQSAREGKADAQKTLRKLDVKWDEADAGRNGVDIRQTP